MNFLDETINTSYVHRASIDSVLSEIPVTLTSTVAKQFILQRFAQLFNDGITGWKIRKVNQ